MKQRDKSAHIQYTNDILKATPTFSRFANTAGLWTLSDIVVSGIWTITAIAGITDDITHYLSKKFQRLHPHFSGSPPWQD